MNDATKRLGHLRAATSALALVVSACTSFPDQSTVVDLRVLAVTSDPSEVILKIDGLPSDPSAKIDPAALSIDPASIPTIHVTPLAPDPAAAMAGRAVTWSLVACPNDPYGAAPPGPQGDAADPAGGANTTVGSTLCDDASPNTWPFATGLAADATADVTLTPAQLLAAFTSDVFIDQHGNVHGGFDLGMPLNLELRLTDGVESLSAVKRVLFWATMLPGQTPNQTPTIPGVTTYVERDTTTWLPVGAQGTLDAKTPTHVALDKGLWLQPDYVPLGQPNATPETYVTTVLSRDPPYQAVVESGVVERIRYAFYATAGTFNPARTVDQNPPGSTPPPNAMGTSIHLESQYLPPASLDDVPVDAATGLHLVTVWVVVRDDRGGESWVTYPLALDPPAP